MTKVKTNAKEQVETPDEQADEKKPLLDENCVAVSPLAGYPGEIRFPKTFTGRMYKHVTTILDRRENGTGHELDDEWKSDFHRLLPYWRVAQSIGVQLDVDGIEPGTEFEDMPVNVLVWIRDCAVEYTDRFLTYTR